MKKNLSICLALLLCCSGKLFSQASEKRILLEEFSTAPCGFCPEGDLIADEIINDYPQVIWVTHHAGFGTDAMTATGSVAVAGDFTNFAPGAAIDRGDYQLYPPYIAVPRMTWDSICVAHLLDPVVAEVGITGNYDSIAGDLTCTVQASFITAPAPGDLRVNLYLLEDSVVGFGSGYDQTNYFNTTPGHAFYGMGNPIVGYVHHHVIRQLVTGAWGLAGIIPNSPAAGSAFTHTFTNISIPANWKAADMSIVAFVSYYDVNPSLRQVLNSQEATLSGLTTGIQPVPGNAQLVIYPNPAGNFITVSRAIQSVRCLVRITDALGRVQYQSSGEGTFHIDISGFDSGVYFIEQSSGNSVLREKFNKL